MGATPVLVDDTPAGPAIDGLEVLATVSGGLDALLRCDVVVKSPGISRYRPEVAQLETAGVPVLRRARSVHGGGGPDPRRLHHRDEGQEHHDGAGRAPADAARATAPGPAATSASRRGTPAEPAPDYWVVETSSFQVPDLTSGPAVVAVTSLSPDHLDWHGTVERYYADKLSLCTKPGVSLALADGSDAELRAQAELLGPHLRWVSDADVGTGHAPGRGARAARRAQRVQRLRRPRGARRPRRRGRLGRRRGWPRRPRASADCRAAAVRSARSAGSSSSTTACRPTCCRRGPRSRPSADRPVALLVGGHDRGLDYGPLGRAVARRTAPTLVVTMPDNGPRIGAAVRDAAGGQGRGDRRRQPRRCGRRPRVGWAQPGGVVLLSPGGAELRALRRLPRARRPPSPRPPPAAGRSAERLMSGGRPAGASSSCSLRKSHHESAETDGGGLDDVGVGPELGQRLHRPPGVLRPPGCGARPRNGCPPRRTRSGGAARRTSSAAMSAACTS